MVQQINNLSAANRQALDHIAACEPVLVGIEPAHTALGLRERELGHAGPPFADDEILPTTVLSALAGAAVIEGWAKTIHEARTMIESREIRLRSNHELGTVSPMAGVVRPSQPLMRVENHAGDGVCYATFAEGGRRALRFGVYDDQVAEHLAFVENRVAPAIADCLPEEGLAVLPLIAQGVTLGDDVHQRNVGGMYAFIKALPDLDADVRSWLLANPQHFLNYAMASAKLCLDQARGIDGSSIVVAIARNGNKCGIQLAGTGEKWFCAPSGIPDGGFYPPFTLQDAQADLGDSAIMEAFGLGGTAAHCAPQLAVLLKTPWSVAVNAGRLQRSFFIAAHSQIHPVLAGDDGLGLGLDAYRVVSSRSGVRIHTGIAHRNGMTGWIGIGAVDAPLDCFTQACNYLDSVTPQQLEKCV
ncbi:DUF1116 domain-containing protein [Thiomicrorhabdus sp. 6S3-12]|uniref:DUF1116 domain-containing protein n=1 Tax=Thiomicrorhabdus sp. 6S3-12 TaxID=2819681 RepID=UPI001AAC4806|nr:DUF1116 domain-containing protein [Thiomicrorhabdus sp. 6S3-12]MBO1924174.1 DUF1116 domain-containing protein [Thiomicrorhabdus sp. 6S3-12]